ncbi:uncharacterized protein N7496_001362 [Penicillium cataractarum]|uniref:Sigma-70 region 2 family protein n=1 Tax=Penicillium cataractarum TaxID=2100454 RepID=A0A9W9VW75_9EURO|nr:uncharacterized protein N7496_001362 [Penicillium cataractarum]KAJ5390294.1 hypothetical protein N7496_001362 [Penicillium cataractarum]
MAAPDKESSSTTQDPANMRWQFIDASDNSRSNLTQVKRHVMQEYIRQKKGSSRNSESEEDSSPPTKRGRPKKTRAAKRKYTKKAAGADKGSNQPKPAKSKAAAEEEEAAPADIEEIAQDIISEAVDPSLVVEKTVALPFRTSPLQSQEFPSQLGDFIDISSHSQSQITDFRSLTAGSSTPTTPLEFTRSPRTILSAARTDPFNTLPLELNREEQKLFDFYVNEMPACSYGSHFRSAKAHNWYTKVFVPEGMKGAVAFQNTILVHAANTWAWVRNETETSNTLVHRDRAVTMLREHLTNNPRDNSDVAIISCLSAAALEDFDPRPGHKEISWVHMRAAREMIRSRGGPVAFENTRLGMLINWQDYILSGYETHGSSFFFEQCPPVSSVSEPPRSSSQPQSSNNLQSIPSPPESTPSACSDITSLEPIQTIVPLHISSPIDEIRLQCEEFLDFLRRCEQLALYQMDNRETCDISRQTAVQPTSILYQTLAAPPGARFTASGDRKQMVARLTALMMLNAALWDYRYTPIRAGVFLKILEQAMVDSEVNMSGSVEAILQILLECNDGPRDASSAVTDGIVSPAFLEELPDFTQYSPTATSPSARPWFAGRMLKIAKRLSADSWHRLNDFLFSCLTLQIQESSVYLWEPDLRQEILSAPLTSYIMPSLFK